MIILEKLSWSNCFSYGENNEIIFTESPVTQILGINGTGKSSIPLILEESLYNKNSKGIKKAEIANRLGPGGYEICLEFSKDSTKYKLDVKRKSNVKVALSKNGEDISSHTASGTYKTITELLGMDFKTFSQLVYQSTNSSLQFLTATDTNRKKFLIDLLHLEEYVAYYELFRNSAKQTSTRISEIKAQLQVIESWLSNNTLEDTTPLPLLNLEKESEEDAEVLSSLTAELKNISEKNSKISKNNLYKKQLASIDMEKLNAIEADKREPYDDLQMEVATAEQEISHSKIFLGKISNLGDKCPTCEQDVDSAFIEGLKQEHASIIKEASERIKERKRIINGRVRNNELFAKKIKGQREWEQLYREIDKSLPNELLDKDTLTEQITTLRAQINDLRKRNEAIRAENTKREKQNTRIQVIQEQTEDFLAKLTVAQEELAVEEELHSNLELLKKAFSTNGLLAYKIENLVKELEELTNKYLGELSEGRFTLQFVVSNDKLNVEITDNGNIIEISALSSGELARVNTATLLAIRKLMSSISKSKINILFLDEVISVLDDNGKEALVEVLIKEPELNTYLVSHHWEHPLLTKIEVVKENGTSHLEK